MESICLARHRYVANHDPFAPAEILYEHGHHAAVEVHDLNLRTHGRHVGAPRPRSGAAGGREDQYRE